MTTPRSRPILIVDDDPEAVALTKRALAKAGIETQIDSVREGDDAIAYLKNCLGEGDDALPLLLFLDLTMPGTAGFQVLNWIRSQPRLRRSLTVVLSSSSTPREGDRTLAPGTKPENGKYALGSDSLTLFQLANSMLTVDEIEKLVLPSLRTPAAATSSGSSA